MRLGLAARTDRVAADDPPDAGLVAAVARGDAAAFRRLVDRYSAAIHRLAYRLLADPNEAEDVTQETFLKLWTHAAGWREAPGGGLLGWLRRVATNLCMDRLRRRKFTSDAVVLDRPDDAPTAETALASRDLSAFAVRALDSLPDRQKAAIVLTYYEELPNAVAAQAMELNIKAFESLLLRARAALRQTMTRAGLGAADLDAPQ